MAGMTKRELAEISGYSFRRLYDIDATLSDGEKLFVPCEGGYDLGEFVRRWVRYKVEQATPDSASLDHLRAEHEKVKIRKTEITVEKMSGALVEAEATRRLFANIANAAMRAMLNVSGKVAPQLVMREDEEEIAALIDDEVRAALTLLADTPVLERDDGGPTPDAEDADAAEDADEDDEPPEKPKRGRPRKTGG